jgi:hypothetical protein
LSGVTFDDGGTASGSFVYDAATNTVSSIDVLTTAGTTFGANKYLGQDPGFSPLPPPFNDIVLVPNSSLSDFTGTMLLDLELATSLTNSVGTINLASMAFEGVCADAGCTFAADTPFRMITGGEITSPVVATPEPSGFLLLGMGFVCLLGAVKVKMLL